MKPPCSDDPLTSIGLSRRRFLGATGIFGAGVVLFSPRLVRADAGPSSGDSSATAPYPKSEIIPSLRFLRDTVQRGAEGSDIWACTWAADGDIYASWGDGGGFGGTDTQGRASLGVAKIIGVPPDWKGENVWGGVSPVSHQVATRGKGTLIALPGAIYLFDSEQDSWDRCRLWKSTDCGLAWTDCGQLFPESHKAFAFPGLVQFGQDNRLSPDGYVYGFSDNDPRRLSDRRLYLFRVPVKRIEELAAYQFFSGTANAPKWSSELAEMKPIFANPAGIGWGTTCVYHPVIGRFLLCVSTSELTGEWGLYESPHLWGPWRTIGYGQDFPEWTYSPAEKQRPAYLHTFPAKWISADGRTLWCVFDRGDHFNLAQCALEIKS